MKFAAQVGPLLLAVVQSRLLQFLAAGGLIFSLAPHPEAPDQVTLSAADLEALRAAQARRTGVPRLSAEAEGQVLSRAIEDEVLYREALRMGLDRSDNVVRQRLIQKVLFLAEDMAGATRPAGEADLRAFFEATRARWTQPAIVHLVHVYAAPSHPELLEGLRAQALAADAAVPDAPPALGEAFPLSRDVTLAQEELAQLYGEDFARRVFALPVGVYAGPLRSRHGWHLVKVIERKDARPATFAEVRGQLPLAYLVARKRDAVSQFVARAMARYRVEVAGKPFTGYQASGRIGTERGEGME